MAILDAIKIYADSNLINPVLIIAGKPIGWKRLQEKIEQFTIVLKELNPSRLMCYFPHSESGIALLLASENLAVETIMVPTYYSKDNAIHFMEEFRAGHLVTVNNEDVEIVKSQPAMHIDQSNHDTSYLCLLTSGTTGIPKCVKHKWKDFYSTITIKKDAKRLSERWILGYPVTHFAGMRVFIQSILSGGTLVIPANFNPRTILNDIIFHQIKYLNCTPTFMRQLLMVSEPSDWSRSKLQYVTLGGEIVDQKLLDSIAASISNVRMTHVYGSTELGALMIIRDGKEGFPLSLIDDEKFKIIDDELFVRYSPTMLGYLNHENVEQKWIGTKDKVQIQGDRVKFLGRVSDIINVAGFKVDPYVVEQVIRKLDGVVEVAVLSKSSPISGELIKAKVQLKEGCDKEKIRHNIIQYCKQQLPYHMVPRLFEFTDSLTFTNTMKLVRREG